MEVINGIFGEYDTELYWGSKEQSGKFELESSLGIFIFKVRISWVRKRWAVQGVLDAGRKRYRAVGQD